MTTKVFSQPVWMTLFPLGRGLSKLLDERYVTIGSTLVLRNSYSDGDIVYRVIPGDTINVIKRKRWYYVVQDNATDSNAVDAIARAPSLRVALLLSKTITTTD